eukprot:SAG31_NODE_8695_length_1405_cov_1.044410_1_plen_110_part_10
MRGLRGNRAIVQCLVLSTNFIGALSGGVLGLAITPIAHDFGVDIELAAWTTLSSMFASDMLGPALGKFADAFGRRRMWWTLYGEDCHFLDFYGTFRPKSPIYAPRNPGLI